jgi:dTDP-4-amino-4,6-dideoxygalactose transaminase
MNVPFQDLKRQTEGLRDEIATATQRVTDSGWFILGEESRAFEAEFATACEAGHAAVVASGTDSATIDVDSLAQALGPKTRAVVPVHLYGQCADLDAVSEIAGEHGVEVVEDCAQAHGARFHGRHAGTLGVMGCFSFYPTKNLGALGDAGAVVTGDEELAERLRRLRNYGQVDRYRHAEAGVNSRMDELQAAILRTKLPHLDRWNERRSEIAAIYADALQGSEAKPLAVLPDRRHVFHLFVLRVSNRDEFQSQMEQRGVQTLIHYPRPIHRQEPYADLARAGGGLARSEELADSIVSLPLFPELTDAEVSEVVEAARESVGA